MLSRTRTLPKSQQRACAKSLTWPRHDAFTMAQFAVVPRVVEHEPKRVGVATSSRCSALVSIISRRVTMRSGTLLGDELWNPWGRLRSCARDIDWCAPGGDEFEVIMTPIGPSLTTRCYGTARTRNASTSRWSKDISVGISPVGISVRSHETDRSGLAFEECRGGTWHCIMPE